MAFLQAHITGFSLNFGFPAFFLWLYFFKKWKAKVAIFHYVFLFDIVRNKFSFASFVQSKFPICISYVTKRKKQFCSF